MKYYFLFLFCILLSWQPGFAQQKSVCTIGILSDIYSPDMESLRQQLKDTIIAVVGQEAVIRFDERFIFSGPPELKKIEDNYNAYLQNPDIDIPSLYSLLYKVNFNQYVFNRELLRE